MASTFIKLPPSSGGGGGAVDSVNGLTGVVVLTKSNVGLGNADNTSDANKPISTATQTALNSKQDAFTGSFNSIAGFDGAGEIQSVPDFNVSTFSGGIILAPEQEMDNNGNRTIAQIQSNVEVLQNSPNDFVSNLDLYLNFDTDQSGFNLGTNGLALRGISNFINHEGTGDVGQIELLQNNFTFGNGTDPINVNGISYSQGFGQLRSGATLLGPIQGYGFQPNALAGSTLTSGASFIQAFYDSANIDTTTYGYSSFNASPTISTVGSGNNYTALNINPTINDFDGNGNFVGIGIYGSCGTFGSGNYTGIVINPQSGSDLNYAAGLTVSVDNLTMDVGAQATLVLQDLTYTSAPIGSGSNAVQIQYIGGGTAGSEVVSNTGLQFEIQIEDNVSTAQQIKDAFDAYGPFVANFTVAVSGTASNTQTVVGYTNFSGGIDAGVKYAAQFDGDVSIDGNLQFTGALSIGALNAFASAAAQNGTGNPTSIHSLISLITLADNESRTAADYLGINTAMLLQIGNNSDITAGFLGLSALGLPAVANIGSGSTVERVAGASFALSLDATAPAGGTIENLDLCRALAIPNGVTTVDRMRGYAFDLPFGNPATDAWGVYITPEIPNYFAGSVVVGTAENPTNSSVGLELNSTTKMFLNARMDSTERNALTAVNGAQIYNTTTDKLQVYAAGSWVDLH